MRPQIQDFRKGEHLTAEKMQKLLDELKRLSRLSVTPPLELYWGATGPTIALRRETVSESTTFKAIIWDRKSYVIDDSANGSSDPAFEDPLMIGCPPAFPPRKRGEYSWLEATEFIFGDPALGTTDRDFGQQGVWVPKPGGRFGKAGECDAALEANRSNAAIELVHMVVDLTETIDVTCSSTMATEGGSANEDASSTFDIFGLETSNVSTRKRYWFNLGVPNSPCAPSYFISISPDNDTP